MPRDLRTLLPMLLLLLLLLSSGASAQDDGIAWSRDLATGLREAKESGRVLMVCVNAKRVEGGRGEEPAAKGLREVVYLDSRVVAKSREFVCVLLTPTSSTMDYAELGNLGMHGEFISPQHIFIAPEGDRILLRKEYWPHGKGEKAVQALLEMMEKAQRQADAPVAPTHPEGGGEVGPADGEARADWIARMLAQLEGTPLEREQALAALVEADQDGDCTGPLIELLPEHKRDEDLLRAMIRALGRDGLDAAAEPICDFLRHPKETIRANAAVSLEYIGCRDRDVVKDLLKAAAREKDEGVANHMFRALGRCGVEEDRALKLLLEKLVGAKSEFASYGPTIGLSYFEEDEKARRGVEKVLGQMGIPGGGRGAFRNAMKRVLLSWTLAWIGDEESAKFVDEELLAPLEKVTAFWADGMRSFWEGVANCCEGDDEAMAVVEGGVRRTAGFASRWGRGRNNDEDTPKLRDEARLDRDTGGFKPRGEGLLEPGEGDWGGGGGGDRGPGGPGGRGGGGFGDGGQD